MTELDLVDVEPDDELVLRFPAEFGTKSGIQAVSELFLVVKEISVGGALDKPRVGAAFLVVIRLHVAPVPVCQDDNQRCSTRTTRSGTTRS